MAIGSARLSAVRDEWADLPKDASVARLSPDRIVFKTRECVLPGTEIGFQLLLERNLLPLRAVVEACLVVARQGRGYVFHLDVPLTRLTSAERRILTLFIAKGRGSARLVSGDR